MINALQNALAKFFKKVAYFFKYVLISISIFIDDKTKVDDQIWERCLKQLTNKISKQHFNTWLRPIQVKRTDKRLTLFMPNAFIKEYFEKNFSELINAWFAKEAPEVKLVLKIGNLDDYVKLLKEPTANPKSNKLNHGLNSNFTFQNFVEGKSNQLAKAAAWQVSQNPGGLYNPLFIYGGVGLGKTHLMQAVGNEMLKNHTEAKILYVHSERFVSDMIKALQRNAISEFKKNYRSVDALLIDDIQFFAGKEHTQEEFFHTFNDLFDKQQQIIITCDRYPSEVEGLEHRLKSRFGWGLTVAVEPPQLETRAAILLEKAKFFKVKLSEEVAFFIAKHIRSNVRELEGALKRVIANATFTNLPITLSLVQEALKDMLVVQSKAVTITNIQKQVAEYYKIKISDLISKKRVRKLVVPRHLAMTIAKELTDRSLMEIGNAFSGRDHTAVIHAQKNIRQLIELDVELAEDYRNLIRILSA